MDPYIRRCFIKRAVDGDTLDCELDVGFNMKIMLRLRLLRVNTPELKGTTKTAALSAKAFTENWVNERQNAGRQIYVRTEKSDVFGRWLAEVMTDEDDCLNDELLKTGHAVPFMR